MEATTTAKLQVVEHSRPAQKLVLEAARALLGASNQPRLLGDVDLTTAARDAEILALRIRQRPEEFQELLAASWNRDQDRASELLADLELNEADFQAAGGGFIWVVVVIILLYSTNAY